MIKNIVFDIGNVLVKFGWEDFFKKFNMPEDVYKKVVKATVGHDTWNEIDRGVFSDEKVLQCFIDNDPSVEEWIRKMFASIHGMLVQFDYAKPWIKELQEKGYKVYCLSNMSFKACRECKDALDFLPMLNGYVLSCEVKIIKPEPEIYKTLLDKYNLVPEECVFMDDLPRNIEAGKKAGMHGIVFTGKEAAMESLKKLEESL